MKAAENAFPEVYIEKSIRKKRIVFKTDLFDLYFTYLGDIVFIALFLTIAMKIYKYSILIATPFFAVVIWFVLNAICLTKLVKVNGGRKKRDIIIKLIQRDFPDLKLISEDSSEIVIAMRYSSLFRGGKMVTVLFDNDSAYINIINLGRNDTYSPFHGWINYRSCKQKAHILAKINQQEI